MQLDALQGPFQPLPFYDEVTEIVTGSLNVTFVCLGQSAVVLVKVKLVLETARCGDGRAMARCWCRGFGAFGALWDRTVTGCWCCCATALQVGLQRAVRVEPAGGRSQVQVVCPVLLRFGDVRAQPLQLCLGIAGASLLRFAGGSGTRVPARVLLRTRAGRRGVFGLLWERRAPPCRQLQWGSRMGARGSLACGRVAVLCGGRLGVPRVRS